MAKPLYTMGWETLYVHVWNAYAVMHFICQVPSELDAIVVGSGPGGLVTAAILAKAGKRVLVVEQHDQAGGTFHTFIDKGYEFDVGVHYIGDVGGSTLTKTLWDQVRSRDPICYMYCNIKNS